MRAQHTCLRCGEVFARPPSARNRYCSQACYWVSLRSTKTLAERVWSRVTKTEGCWLWTGSKTVHGYGLVSNGHTGWAGYAHRLIYAWTFGPIPDGMEVCHRCDTPSCVRPEHLFLGTHADNMHDMAAKGRHWMKQRQRAS